VSGEPGERPEEQQGGVPGASENPSEEELRAAYEAEVNRMTSADMIAQAAVSLLNLGARRLGLLGDPSPGAQDADPRAAGAGGAGRDLEQVRDAIDAVRALLEILERRMPQELRPLRDALAQLQIAYAREMQVAGAGAPANEAGGPEPQAPAPGAPGGQAGPAGPQDAPEGKDEPGGPGPAQSSGRLWVPGS
jgi:hypothetical protein